MDAMIKRVGSGMFVINCEIHLRFMDYVSVDCWENISYLSCSNKKRPTSSGFIVMTEIELGDWIFLSNATLESLELLPHLFLYTPLVISHLREV